MRSHPKDKHGHPVPRDCTCKNKACRTKFQISWESDYPVCPKCKTVHCPNCLSGFTEALKINRYRYGLEVTVEEVPCPKCGWNIFEYEYI